MLPSFELNRRYIFGVDTNQDIIRNSGLAYLDEKRVCYIANNIVIIQDVQTGEQHFISDHDSICVPIGIASTKLGLVILGQDSKSCSESIFLKIYHHPVITEEKLNNDTALVLKLPDEILLKVISFSISADSNIIVAIILVDSSKSMLVFWDLKSGKFLTQSDLDTTAESCMVNFHGSDSSLCCISTIHNVWYYKLLSSEHKWNAIVVNFPISLKDSYLDLVQDEKITCHCWLDELKDMTIFGTTSGKLLVTNSGKYKSHMDVENACACNLVSIPRGYVAAFSSLNFYIFHYQSDSDTFVVKNTISIKDMTLSATSVDISSMKYSPGDSLLCVLLSGINQIYKLKLLDQNEHSFQNRVQRIAIGHIGSISGIDTCIQKSQFITVGSDHTVRLWDFERKSQLYLNFYQEEPLSVAFHPSGLHAIVAFSDKVRCLHLLVDDFREFWQYPVKLCRIVKFSSGGHIVALANGVCISVYNFYTGGKVTELKGHNSKVNDFVWDRAGDHIFSVDDDGVVIRWNLINQEKILHSGKGKCKHNRTYLSLASWDTLYHMKGDGNIEVIESTTMDMKNIVKDPNFSEKYRFKGPLLSSNEESSFVVIGFASDPDSNVSDSIRLLNILHKDSIDFLYTGNMIHLKICEDDQTILSVSDTGVITVFSLTDNRGLRHLPIALEQSDNQKNRKPYVQSSIVNEVYLEEKDAIIDEICTQLCELKTNHEYKVNIINTQQDASKKELNEKYFVLLQNEDHRLKSIDSNIQKLRSDSDRKISQVRKDSQSLLYELETIHRNELIKVSTHFQNTISSWETELLGFEQERKEMSSSHDESVKREKEKLSLKLQESEITKNQIKNEVDLSQSECVETLLQVEEEVDEHIEQINNKYDNDILIAKARTLKLSGENGIMQKKTDALGQEIEEQKDTIKNLLSREEEHRTKIAILKNQMIELQTRITEKDYIISSKTSTLGLLDKSQNELEKFRFIFEEKLQSISTSNAPREQSINEEIKNSEAKLKKLKSIKIDNEILENKIIQIRNSIKQERTTLSKQSDKISFKDTHLRYLVNQIHECIESIQDPSLLIDKLRSIKISKSSSLHGGTEVVEVEDEDEILKQTYNNLHRKLSDLKKQEKKLLASQRSLHTDLQSKKNLLLNAINDLREKNKQEQILINKL